MEKSTFKWLRIDNGEDDRFGVGKNDIKHAKRLEKLSKLGKLKKEKIFKSWNLTKSRKKLSKSGNLTNFNVTEDKSKFLTLDAKIAFNYLRLAFTKALIFWYFDPKCHIWIETNILGYTIDKVLN